MAFQAADGFAGARPGFVFKMGPSGLGYYAEGAVETVERWHFGQVEVVVQVDVAMRSLTGLRIWPAARRLAELLAKDAPSERRTRSLVRRPAGRAAAGAGRRLRPGLCALRPAGGGRHGLRRRRRGAASAAPEQHAECKTLRSQEAALGRRGGSGDGTFGSGADIAVRRDPGCRHHLQLQPAELDGLAGSDLLFGM
ncbi:unnamed protein product [Effrenium voratum]|nr:unnamed protein product [Effrenium voratum]